MSTRKRTSRRKKKTGNRLRNLIFILIMFAGFLILLALVVPPEGFVRSTGHFLYSFMGWLSFFIPLLLFQTGARILGLRSAGKGYRIVFGGFFTGYFLASLVALVGSRFSPEYIYIPGGRIAGSLAVAMMDMLGDPLAFLAIFACFTGALVAVTGWDLVGDFQNLSKHLGHIRILQPISKKRGTSRAEQKDMAVTEVPNVWSKKSSSTPDVFPPFHAEDSEVKMKFDPAPPGSTGKQTAADRRHPAVREFTSLPVTTTDEGKDIDSRYALPAKDILTFPPVSTRIKQSEREIRERADLLVDKLADFGVVCKVANSYPGPVLTRFELKPGPGVKVNRILNLADDLALALAAKRIRILAPVPGKGAVGIEVPNAKPETVFLGEVLSGVDGRRLPIALGRKLEGEPFAVDICDMPHLLISGATGSGKSICIHSIISTLLMTRTPHEVRLAMVDPKMLELSIYEKIPHLWAPVVLEAKKAKVLLDALVIEMENRYARLARTGLRSINEFNDQITAESEDERIPYIVVIIDELADLMMVSSNEVEPPITRLAGMARAVGIHLVVATQRPSVDVITGVIKANFPTRIAFNVQSKTDSRTILDMNGAEKLLGNGDMLFLPSSSPEPVRVHGSFVSTDEIKRIVDHWQHQPPLPFEFEFPSGEAGNIRDPGEIKLDDPLLEQAKQLVIRHQQGSVSLLQRRLSVGYSRAGRLIDMLEQMGVVGPFLGSKARDVLVQPEPDPLTGTTQVGYTEDGEG